MYYLSFVCMSHYLTDVMGGTRRGIKLSKAGQIRCDSCPILPDLGNMF